MPPSKSKRRFGPTVPIHRKEMAVALDLGEGQPETGSHRCIDVDSIICISVDIVIHIYRYIDIDR